MMELDNILEILRHNEEIAGRFFEIEKRILTILDYTDLFEVLLKEIQRQFKVPHAWISLIEWSEISRLVQELEASQTLSGRLNVIDQKIFTGLVGREMTPLLANRDIERYAPLLPAMRKFDIGSLAVAPIALDGAIIGSLNQADPSRDRFKPGIDTSLLEQLAVKVSLCLSNVTAHEKLRFLAYHDPLTGLLNRRVMTSVLNREFARAKRYPACLSVVFVDLDRFKQVNDVHGHDRGDELLVHVAEGLQKMCRTTDIIARYAGDEFVIILPGTTADSASKLMDRVRGHFSENPFRSGTLTIDVSISFGIASTDAPGTSDPGSLLKKADQMLYEAKKKPRS
jgi:diguanylate cyclase (GGDEF)-like protein